MNLDQLLFRFINHDLANPVFDAVMPFMTTLNEEWTGAIALLVLMGYLVRRFRKKVGWVLLGLLVCVGAADSIAYRIIKPAVQRPRPSFVMEDVELRVDKHSGYSFPSNHAANTFAGATLLALLAPGTSAFFLSYASLVSFSRVYVGVHYPLDVLAGGLLGALLGCGVFWMMRRKFSTLQRPA